MILLPRKRGLATATKRRWQLLEDIKPRASLVGSVVRDGLQSRVQSQLIQ